MPGVSAYVVDGLKKERIKPILDTADQPLQRLRPPAPRARRSQAASSPSARSIDRAKGILMRTRGMSEDEAYALLRKTAMNQSRRIAEIAESLIVAVRPAREERTTDERAAPRHIRAGFMPLIDAAPLIVAARRASPRPRASTSSS